MSDELALDRDALGDELVRTRRALHQHPELSFAEHQTAALVTDRLRALGLRPRGEIGGTGVIADLQGGGRGPTLMLRADMDALPVDEIAGRSYGSSVGGVMHACGHDAHVSALLGAARLLCDRRERLAGRVRLLFQPAEEIGRGARAMIDDGALDGVDEALAAHVFTPLPFGHVGVRAGDMLAGAVMFELHVRGDGGHAATAHESRDAVLAAAQLVVALQAIVARETAPGSMLVLSIASVQGGTAVNVMASQVVLRGTLRWSHAAVRDRAIARMREIAGGVCQAFRVEHELCLLALVPPLHCARTLSELLADGASACADTTVMDPGLLPFSEDFGVFAEHVPAAFCLVGAAGPGNGSHHAADFDIDERVIGLAAEILTRAALARLDASRPITASNPSDTPAHDPLG